MSITESAHSGPAATVERHESTNMPGIPGVGITESAHSGPAATVERHESTNMPWIPGVDIAESAHNGPVPTVKRNESANLPGISGVGITESAHSGPVSSTERQGSTNPVPGTSFTEPEHNGPSAIVERHESRNLPGINFTESPHSGPVASLERHLSTDLSEASLTESTHSGSVATVEQLLAEALAADATFLGTPMAALALKQAAENGHTAIVRLLLQVGVDVNVKYKGTTALHEAVKAGMGEVLQYLLMVPGIEQDAFNAAGRTAVMETAHRGRVHCLSILLAAGCSPCVQNVQLRQAMHYCVLPSFPTVDPEDTLACLGELKSAGADLNPLDMFRMTPLHLAVMNDNVEVAVWLLGNECSLEVEAAPVDLPPGNFSSLPPHLAWTPLLLALHLSNRRLAHLLVRCGARYTHLGWTVQYCTDETVMCEFFSQGFVVLPSLQQLCRDVLRDSLKPGIDRNLTLVKGLPPALSQYILLQEELLKA